MSRGPYKRNPERISAMRTRIIECAAEVIGQRGYTDASIARIVEKVDISQGTFYRYFDTRQMLFDAILPFYADRMIDYISEHTTPDTVGLDREMERFGTFLAFISDHPWFIRLADEAIVHTPVGHAAYFEKVVSGYVRSLQRSVDRGEIVGYQSEDIEAVAVALLAVRNYYAKVYLGLMSDKQESHAWATNDYRAFVERALFAAAPTA